MSAWLRIRSVADRVIAAVAVAAASPLIAVLVLLVWLDDRGPGLISVPRVGRGGTTFGMWKIRSMRSESSSGHASGIGLTRGDDERITPIGRWIRRLHFDELPQLCNVVRGEMTLLGPRPEAPGYVELGDERWIRVLRAAPGIAGPTQLIVGDWERDVITRETGEADYLTEVVPVKLAIDEWYVASASPALDLLVVTTLVRHVLWGTEASRLQSVVRRGRRGSRHTDCVATSSKQRNPEVMPIPSGLTPPAAQHKLSGEEGT